jgi:hypothetical protein
MIPPVHVGASSKSILAIVHVVNFFEGVQVSELEN